MKTAHELNNYQDSTDSHNALDEIAELTLCNNKRYGVSGLSVLVGSDALVDVCILQGQVSDLKWSK